MKWLNYISMGLYNFITGTLIFVLSTMLVFGFGDGYNEVTLTDYWTFIIWLFGFGMQFKSSTKIMGLFIVTAIFVYTFTPTTLPY